MSKSWLPIILVTGVVTLSGCGSKGTSSAGSADSGDALITINGEGVSAEDFRRFMQVKPTIKVDTGQGIGEAAVADTIGFQVLQDLITQKLIIQLAKEDNLYPTDEDIKKEREMQDRLNPGFMGRLKDKGMTEKDVDDSLRMDLARERIVTKGITVTMPEVDAYIKQNQKNFMDPAMVDSLFIFVKTNEDKAKVDAELASGKPFVEVAKAMSQVTASPEDKARFKIRVLDQYPVEVKPMVEATKEGSTTGWAVVQGGFVKMFIEKKAAAKPMEINDDRKRMLMRNIAIQKGQQATDLPKRIYEKLKASKIDVEKSGLKSIWEKALSQMKQSDLAASAAGGAAGQAPPQSSATTPNPTPKK